MSKIRIIILFMGLLIIKMLAFDFYWCLNTTFTSFSMPQTYLSKYMFAAAMAFPLLFWRSRWYCGIIAAVFDAFIIANLLYFRTYFTVIPLSNYALIDNLSGFTDSVLHSFRWSDLIYPLTTALFFWIVRKRDFSEISISFKKTRKLLVYSISLPMLCFIVYFAIMGGYKSAYESLLKSKQTCGAPMYTILGVLGYEMIMDKVEYTPEVAAEIKGWIKEHERMTRHSLPYSIEARDNCIIILAESMESFPIGKSLDGKEITPNLNAFLKEDNVLYCPSVLTQAKGARSIDAQLLLHTGLLPLQFGAYSSRFPHNIYPSLDKAFKEKYHNGVTCSFTVDKRVVWNVGAVAKSFGYDILLDKPHFVLDEKTGPMGRLGDVSFLRQSSEKIMGEDYFKTGGHTLLQCVTYSGHDPFVIPEESKRISFSSSMPEVLERFLVVANYTDYAIGEFVRFIRSNPKFQNTMIVITGDHEALGTRRRELRKDPVGKEIVGEGYYTPFIVLNSPVSLLYDKVMGQVDMYPTLLDLLGMQDYSWKGLGESILSPHKKPYAISPQMEIVGDTTGVSKEEIEHAVEAWKISDLMLKTDFFAKENSPLKNRN